MILYKNFWNANCSLCPCCWFSSSSLATTVLYETNQNLVLIFFLSYQPVLSFSEHSTSAPYHSHYIQRCHIPFLHLLLVHALVSSRLDFYNLLLNVISKDKLMKLQRTQNILTRAITRTWKSEHVLSPILKSFH